MGGVDCIDGSSSSSISIGGDSHGEWSMLDPSIADGSIAGDGDWSIVTSRSHHTHNHHDRTNEADANTESDVWSISSQFSSVHLSESTNDTNNDDTSFHTLGSKNKRPPTLTSLPEEGEETGNNDSYDGVELMDLERPKFARKGKSAVKQSLVKKQSNSHCHPCYYDESLDHLEVVDRPYVGKSKFRAKTIVDDLLPDLSPDNTTGYCTWWGVVNLERAGRWESIPELFEDLVRTGVAVQIPDKDWRRNTRGQDSLAPCDVTTYSVKANGEILPFGNTKSSFLSNERFVYALRKGRWRRLYSLTTKTPDVVGDEYEALRGSRKSKSSKSRAKDGVNRTVDLVFGRSMDVRYASLSGKVHDRKYVQVERSKLEAYGPNSSGSEFHVPDDWNTKGSRHPHIPVIVEDTEAYSDRVEISARLSKNPRVWVSLGTFNGCKNCYTKEAIDLKTSDAADKDGNVSCIALRFHALSWHNEPILRVGAYGRPTGSARDDSAENGSNEARNSDQSEQETFKNETVKYTIYRYKSGEHQKDKIRRKFGNKEGKSHGNYAHWRGKERERERKEIRHLLLSLKK